jgi:hypothetical protein
MEVLCKQVENGGETSRDSDISAKERCGMASVDGNATEGLPEFVRGYAVSPNNRITFRQTRELNLAIR